MTEAASLRPPGSTLDGSGAFAPKAAPPPQGPRSEPLFALVGHRVYPALLLSVLAVEEHALGQPCVVHAADARTHGQQGEITGGRVIEAANQASQDSANGRFCETR